MRIELTTGGLQILLAPLEHAGPLHSEWNRRELNPHYQSARLTCSHYTTTPFIQTIELRNCTVGLPINLSKSPIRESNPCFHRVKVARYHYNQSAIKAATENRTQVTTLPMLRNKPLYDGSKLFNFNNNRLTLINKIRRLSHTLCHFQNLYSLLPL